MIELQEKCSEAEENKNQCLSITLSNRNYKCCMVEIINDDHYDYDRDYSCIVIVSDTNLLRETYNNKLFKAQLREIFGYINNGIYFIDDDGNREYIGGDSTFRFKEIFQCNDGTVEYSFGYDTYSSNDIAIYDSGNHCLKYFYRYLYPENYDENSNINSVSKSDCQNAQLTPDTKNAGIKCGFYQFKINYIKGGSKT